MAYREHVRAGCQLALSWDYGLGISVPLHAGIIVAIFGKYNGHRFPGEVLFKLRAEGYAGVN